MWLHRKMITEKKKNRKDSWVPTGKNRGRQPREKQCWGLSSALRSEGTQGKENVGKKKEQNKRSEDRENNWQPVAKKKESKGLKYRESKAAMRYLCWKWFPHDQCSIMSELRISNAELVMLQFHEWGEKKMVVLKYVDVHASWCVHLLRGSYVSKTI